MRSRLRTAVVVLVAVSALGGLGSASALAVLPEFRLQGNTKFPVTFTGTGDVNWETAGGSKFFCRSKNSVTGAIVSTTEVAKVVAKFPKCGAPGFCVVEETKELKGRIAYLPKRENGEKVVGLLLEPVTAPVSKCEEKAFGTLTTLLGSVIGEIRPTNISRVGPFHLTYQQASSKQQLRKFEGEELGHNLEVIHNEAPSEPIGLGGELTLTMAHEIEIRR